MAISLLDNLNIRKKRPNVERDAFDTLADMKAYNENYLPDVFIALCYEDRNLYKFDVDNAINEITGKWRKFESGGSSESSVISVNGLTGEVEITASTIGAVDTEEFNTINAKVLTLEQTTVPNLEGQVETNTSNISTLEKQVNTNTSKVTTLEEQIGGAASNASNAYAKAQEAEIKVSVQQSTVTNLSNQISDLWVAANRHDDNISLLETDVAKKANSSEVYTMNQVDSMLAGSISAVYKYKGNVASVSDLADITSPNDGYVYFVESEALNYAYTEGSWKPLAGIIDMSDYVSQADFSTALSSKADISAIPTKVSDLYNDEQHVTRTEVEAMLSSAGVGAVQTVNGQYGNVVLTASDVGALTPSDMNTALTNYYTKTEVDSMFGDIEAILDIINGETV